jgi:hypothetical protein
MKMYIGYRKTIAENFVMQSLNYPEMP